MTSPDETPVSQSSELPPPPASPVPVLEANAYKELPPPKAWSIQEAPVERKRMSTGRKFGVAAAAVVVLLVLFGSFKLASAPPTFTAKITHTSWETTPQGTQPDGSINLTDISKATYWFSVHNNSGSPITVTCAAYVNYGQMQWFDQSENHTVNVGAHKTTKGGGAITGFEGNPPSPLGLKCEQGTAPIGVGIP